MMKISSTTTDNATTTTTKSSSNQTTTTTTTTRIMPKIARDLLEKVSLNRLTIVIGPTGSGKSTGIPPLLLHGLSDIDNNRPILCTQPRRLAVVAIAKHVATTFPSKEDVAYHVGNHNTSTSQTKLLFTTAGILLEEMRANGIKALTKFKCIVLDECHERSPESDLVLSFIKQFMKETMNNNRKKSKNNIRIVLMSATFDHERYKRFFSSVVPTSETIDTITLETAASFDSFHSMVDTFYLEDVARQIMGTSSSSLRPWLRQMRMNPTQDLNYDDGRTLSPGLISFIKHLVIVLDQEESKQSPFLIFAPTYRHLEQLYDMMMELQQQNDSMNVHVSVLHSSVDIQDCLRSMMNDNNSNRRHVFLASAIADSSITVPGVSCIIDLCRTLQVRWENNRNYNARTIWASKSICDQRRGRTGRTCSGRVFRLVPKGFYIANLINYDIPQLTLSSCHNEILKIICCSNNNNNTSSSSTHSFADNPKKLLSSCLDAPDPSIVNDAITYLTEIGACMERNDSKKKKGTTIQQQQAESSGDSIIPTPYGSLLGSLPLTVAEAKVVLAGATIGLLYETLVIQAIHSHKPNPIVSVFGKEEENLQVMQTFYHKTSPTDIHSQALAHLSAFLFWDVEWNHYRRQRRTSSGLLRGNTNMSSATTKSTEALSSSHHWTPKLEQEHEQWCRKFHINPTSVRSISELMENTMSIFYLERYEPDWLRSISCTPIWKRPGDWKGSLFVPHGHDMFQRIYGLPDSNTICDALLALCRSRGDVTKAIPFVQKLSSSSYSSLLSNVQSSTENQQQQYNNYSQQPEACIHFLMGTCKYGKKCFASHSPYARRPLCRYYQNGNCTRGDQCIYSHGDEDNYNTTRRGTKNGVGTKKTKKQVEQDPLRSMLPLCEEHMVFGENPMRWFETYHQVLCMLGEGTFSFTSVVLEQRGCPPVLATTLEGDDASATHYSTTTTPRWYGVDATRLHENSRFIDEYIRTHRVCAFAWNYPFTGQDEDAASNEMLLFQTFQSIACLMLLRHSDVQDLYFGIMLQQDQFSRWNVWRSAFAVGWRFIGWCEVGEDDFVPYKPTRGGSKGNHFPVMSRRFYTFQMTRDDLPKYNVMVL